MKLVNLTPHAIFLYKENRLVETLEPSGVAVRLQPVVVNCGTGSFPVHDVRYERGTPLPPKEDGTYYVVSYMVADFYKNERDDLVFPFDLVRGMGGRVVGCHSFARVVS